MGAEAIKELLQRLDLDILIPELKAELKETHSEQKKLKIAKRLKIMEAFRKSGNKPE